MAPSADFHASFHGRLPTRTKMKERSASDTTSRKKDTGASEYGLIATCTTPIMSGSNNQSQNNTIPRTFLGANAIAPFERCAETASVSSNSSRASNEYYFQSTSYPHEGIIAQNYGADQGNVRRVPNTLPRGSRSGVIVIRTPEENPISEDDIPIHQTSGDDKLPSGGKDAKSRTTAEQTSHDSAQIETGVDISCRDELGSTTTTRNTIPAHVGVGSERYLEVHETSNSISDFDPPSPNTSAEQNTEMRDCGSPESSNCGTDVEDLKLDNIADYTLELFPHLSANAKPIPIWKLRSLVRELLSEVSDLTSRGGRQPDRTHVSGSSQGISTARSSNTPALGTSGKRASADKRKSDRFGQPDDEGDDTDGDVDRRNNRPQKRFRGVPDTKVAGPQCFTCPYRIQYPKTFNIRNHPNCALKVYTHDTNKGIQELR